MAHKKNRTCSVEGCGGRHVANGLCETHYRRLKRRGTLKVDRRQPGIGTVTSHGYIAVGKDKKLQHVAIAESVLGRALPVGAEVHHINGDKADNRRENLVVCPSRAYHFLLHQRTRALEACGNAGYRKCPFCKQYDNPQNMKESKHGRHLYHADCRNQYGAKQRSRQNGGTLRG